MPASLGENMGIVLIRRRTAGAGVAPETPERARDRAARFVLRGSPMEALRIPRERPDLRERALCLGPAALSDAELVALVLGTGVGEESARGIAVRLLDDAGDLPGVARLGGHALAARRGIGPAKAARVLAAIELGQRAADRLLVSERKAIASFDAVVAWGRPRLAALEHEEVWMLTLDARNGLRGAHRVAQGGVHACALTPRDVLRPAIRDGASAIVLLHNHPSGDPAPSQDDVTMTRALARAAAVVGVVLLDHVVVARGGASSLRDFGALGTLGTLGTLEG